MEFIDYFNEIEARFRERRMTPFMLLSHIDTEVAKEWYQQGVPLAVVIEAIDFVFEKHNERKTPNGLRFFKHAVKDLWRERRELLVGENAATPEADYAQQLEALATAIAHFPEIADQVRGLASEKSVPKIEERLIELESELIAQAMATLPDDEVDAIRADISRNLGGLDDKTRARTEQANLRRIVRERFGLPRLTLF